MTGYTVHTGASKKFVDGWDSIFGDSKTAKKAGKKKSTKASASAKKKAGKKKKKK